MSSDSNDPDMLVAEMAAVAQTSAGEHPALERLSDYLAGTLEPAAEKSLNDHLVACPRCARELLELKAFEEDEALADGTDGEFRTRAAWRAVRGKLDLASSAGLADHWIPSQGSSPPFQRNLHAVAASLLMAVVCLGGWVAHLKSEGTALDSRLAALRDEITDLRQELSQWTPPVEGRFLATLPLTSRSDFAPYVVEVPAGSSSLVLSLYIPDTESFSSYDIEVLDLRGKSVWSRSGVPLTDAETLEAAFSRLVVGDGEIRLRCIGIRDGEPRDLADLMLQIRWL